ncbi:MAG TPA: hypothetical protein VMJ35_15185 [Dongiaceae bacterium]|nr:hypothetical protein [Dongiaceae bacterium]
MSKKAPLGLLVFWLCVASSFLTATAQEPAASLSEKSATIEIPDGTKVEIRFAESVWGTGTLFHPRQNHAAPGQTVRLVVAEDLVLNGKVVLRKGSPGQASIETVWEPSYTPQTGTEFCTCLSLKLDWIKSIDDEEVLVRAHDKPDLKAREKDKPQLFSLEVNTTHTGTVAKPVPFGFDFLKPGNFTKEYLSFISGRTAVRTLHQKDWIPIGTRMTVFTEGVNVLNAEKINEAQDLLPAVNENATVMFYRTKGQKNDWPIVTCDSDELGAIGLKQFLSLEMTPGKHTCFVDPKNPFEFSVVAGQECYIYLHSSSLGSWHLSMVSNQEGEDGVAAAEPATEPESHKEKIDKPKPDSF